LSLDIIHQLVVLIVGFGCAAIACGVLAHFAPKLGLLDHPSSERKHHAAPTPVVGGLAIVMAAMACAALMPWSSMPKGLMLAMLLIIGVGILDDRMNLNWVARFAAQAVAALLIIYIDGTQVTQLGSLFGYDVQLGWLSTPFTVAAIIGLINAINMADGIDGLAGTLAFLALAMTAAVAAFVGDHMLVMTLLPFIGGIAGFLLFNMRFPWQPRAKLFLGNGGSEFLGLLIAWGAFRLTQTPAYPVDPVLTPYFLAPALIDCIAVMLRRMAARRSPFSADRGHLHHTLLRWGLSVSQTVWTMAAATVVMAVMAFVGWRANAPEGWNVLVFGVILTIYTLVSGGVFRPRGAREAVAQ
jgi:UDP-GlcNAc:undecaprenyl-phosphate GlcNAc-1-phosphate transferase